MKRQVAKVTEDDIKKLPLRFRLHIQALENRVEELERAQAKDEPSLVMLDPYGAKKYLPNRATIRYGDFSDRNEQHCIDVDYRDGALRVSAPFGMLSVQPEVANVVSIVLRPR